MLSRTARIKRYPAGMQRHRARIPTRPAGTCRPVATIRASRAAIDPRAGGLHRRIGAIVARVGAIVARVGAMVARVGAMVARVRAMVARSGAASQSPPTSQRHTEGMTRVPATSHSISTMLITLPLEARPPPPDRRHPTATGTRRHLTGALPSATAQTRPVAAFLLRVRQPAREDV